MKVVICYFSGTGNTAKVTHAYSDSLAERGAIVETYAMEDLLINGLSDEFLNKLNDAELLGIAYPVHAFNAPSIVLKFVKSLPKATANKRAFIVSTSGEPLKLNNISSLKTQSLLKHRNYCMTNEYHYVMPYNIIFRHNDTMAYRMWELAQKLIPLDVKDILDGNEHKLDKVFCGGLVAWVMRCEHWGGRINGKLYKVDDKCAHCQKCVSVCPTKNITAVDGKLKFGKNCLMCQRCINLCPKNAIKMGLFNKWKVNGAYSFVHPTEEQTQKYNKMLTKAYNEYFEENEKRISPTEQSETNTKAAI